MPDATPKTTPLITALLAKLADDPWALPHAERRNLLDSLIDAQLRWLPKLAAMVEPPVPAAEFPAFLLETSMFEGVRTAIENAGDDVDTATLDLVQHFVDQYRHYMEWTEAELNSHRNILADV